MAFLQSSMGLMGLVLQWQVNLWSPSLVLTSNWSVCFKKSFLGSDLIIYISLETDLFCLDFQVYLHNFMQSMFLDLIIVLNHSKCWSCVYGFLTHPLKNETSYHLIHFVDIFQVISCVCFIYILFQNHKYMILSLISFFCFP